MHPPTPTLPHIPTTMDEHPHLSQAAQARRRSSSLASAHLPGTAHRKNKHRRVRSEHHIPEEQDSSDERESSDDKSDSTDVELDDMGSDDGLEDDEETGLTGRDKRKRRRRKRRNTRLDNRFVPPPGGDDPYRSEEERAADQSVLREGLINAALIALWYLFSISISVYNKWMFTLDPPHSSDDPDADPNNGQPSQHIFPFPLFTTCLHMIVQFSLASLVLFLIPSLRPRHDSLNPHAAGVREREEVDPKKPLMTRWFYVTRIGPCGVATGLDIGLGNTSLKFISLTFFTMCKSSALIFVLLFAFLFRLESPSWRLAGLIFVMTAGVVMMVFGETAFDTLGFILVMASAASSGFRWSLTQILLLRNPATANPFSSIFFLAPVMFFSLVLLAIPVEGVSALIAGLAALFDKKGALLGTGILLFPGVLAFLMTSSEFALLKRTSVVTLSICGIFKEVVTITTANMVFDDKLTGINVTGLVVTIASIATYNWMKIQKMREEARMSAHLRMHGATEGGGVYAPVGMLDPDPVRRGSPAAVGGSSAAAGARRLSLAPGPAGRSSIESPLRASPVKRPEDLD